MTNVMRRAALILLACALAAGCAQPAPVMRPSPEVHAPPPPPPPAGRPDSPPAAQVERPFARVLAIEPVQLAEAMLFRQGGQTVAVRDVLIVYLRPAHGSRFVPKDIETPTVVLEDAPSVSLYPPIRAVWAIVVPRPTIALRDGTLWVAPIGSKVTEQEKGSVVALRRAAQRAHPGDVVALATVPAAAEPGATVTLRDGRALLTHALARADSLARKEK